MKGTEGQISDGLMAVQFLMALSFVVGLIFLAAWILKRYSAIGRNVKHGLKMPVSIVSTTPLGDKKYLIVTEVEGEYFFLGVTSGGINLISRLDPPEGAGEEQPDVSEQSGDFKTALKRAGEFLKGGKQ